MNTTQEPTYKLKNPLVFAYKFLPHNSEIPIWVSRLFVAGNAKVHNNVLEVSRTLEHSLKVKEGDYLLVNGSGEFFSMTETSFRSKYMQTYQGEVEPE